MNLTEHIENIYRGEAVLFAGAGFSMEALANNGEPVVNSTQLTQMLSAGTDLPPDVELEEAAEEFARTNGEEALVELLRDAFTVKEITSAQAAIAMLPWRRVYTTNYDNTLEFGRLTSRNRFAPVTPTSDIAKVKDEQNLCVHLNGYVGALSASSIWKELKLTASSYLSESLATSPWMTLFRQDLRIARSVIFIGYSLRYDLDIRRILFDTPELKQKTIFILGKETDEGTKRRAERFGTISDLDVASFAQQGSFTPDIPSDESPGRQLRYLERYQAPLPSSDLRDRDMIDLFLYGKLDLSILWRVIHSAQHRYFLKRTLVDSIVEVLDREPYVVLHSDLGNGKTMFVEGVKAKAVEEGWHVFTALESGAELMREASRILAQGSQRILIVAESYPKWYEFLEFFAIHRTQDARLLLSERSIVHDVTIDRLCKILRVDDVAEFDLNKLERGERQWFIETMDSYGLWGKMAAASRQQKEDFIVNRCENEIHAILLEILSSPVITGKVQLLMEEIDNAGPSHELIVSVFALSAMGYEPTISAMVDIFGPQNISRSGYRRGSAISQLIQFDKHSVRSRSSVLGEYILRNVADADVTVAVLIKIAKRADDLRRASNYFWNLFKDLNRFSVVQHLLPLRERTRAVFHYYETVKNFGGNKENPLFWLQYGIAAMAAGDLGRAEKYFETSYSFARRMDWFDSRQIDNHVARLLLIRSRGEQNIEKAYSDYKKARNIILRQIEKERVHFPYRVAKEIGPWVASHLHELSRGQKSEIQKDIGRVLQKIAGLADHRRRHIEVRKCHESLQPCLDILDAAASTSAPAAK